MIEIERNIQVSSKYEITKNLSYSILFLVKIKKNHIRYKENKITKKS